MPKKGKSKSLAEKFWAKVAKSDGCWLWTGYVYPGGTGYGTVVFGGRRLGAHRASLIVHGIDLPDGSVVCHSCNNKICVNPAHLRVGTSADNNEQARQDGIAAIGERVGTAKLLDAEAAIIKEELRRGGRTGELARRFRVAPPTISDIKAGRTWGHLDKEAPRVR